MKSWFWGYENKYGSEVVKPYNGSMDDICEAKRNASIIAIAHPFEARNYDEAVSLLKSKLESSFRGRQLEENMKKAAAVAGIKTTVETPEEKPNVIIRKTNEYLKCEFTQKELEEMSSEMAMKFQELSRQKDEKNSVASSYATKIKETESRIKTLSDNVSSRSEIRSVRCEWHMNAPKKGKKTLFRTDTGDTVRIDDMLDSDSQMVLDDLKKSEKTLDEKTVTPIEPEPENHEIIDGGEFNVPV